MRGTHNVGGIADPVIDALVESVIAANSRMDLLTACKALESSHSKRPLLGTALVQSRALARILGLVRSAISTTAIRPGYPTNLVVKRSELEVHLQIDGTRGEGGLLLELGRSA
jgi:hypothetical protein